MPLVSPANKQKLDIIVVGTGLAGASAASSLAEMGYILSHFVSKTAQEELIQLLPKVELMLLKIIKMMEIVFTDYSTIQ